MQSGNDRTKDIGKGVTGENQNRQTDENKIATKKTPSIVKVRNAFF